MLAPSCCCVLSNATVPSRANERFSSLTKQTQVEMVTSVAQAMVGWSSKQAGWWLVVSTRALCACGDDSDDAFPTLITVAGSITHHAVSLSVAAAVPQPLPSLAGLRIAVVDVAQLLNNPLDFAILGETTVHTNACLGVETEQECQWSVSGVDIGAVTLGLAAVVEPVGGGAAFVPVTIDLVPASRLLELKLTGESLRGVVVLAVSHAAVRALKVSPASDPLENGAVFGLMLNDDPSTPRFVGGVTVDVTDPNGAYPPENRLYFSSNLVAGQAATATPTREAPFGGFFVFVAGNATPYNLLNWRASCDGCGYEFSPHALLGTIPGRILVLLWPGRT